MIERLMAAERCGALVKPEYEPLQKAFLLYAGYAQYLPKDFVFHSLERALAARLIREGRLPPWRLNLLAARRAVLGPKAVSSEINVLIDGL